MGNIRGWGGPLPPSWRKNQLDLQHKILTAMRNLGMAPVLPGFAGFVPDGLKRVYPQAKLSRVSRWGRFNNTFCCGYHLHPNDPLFKVSHWYIFVHILSYKSRRKILKHGLKELRLKSTDTSLVELCDARPTAFRPYPRRLKERQYVRINLSFWETVHLPLP